MSSCPSSAAYVMPSTSSPQYHIRITLSIFCIFPGPGRKPNISTFQLRVSTGSIGTLFLSMAFLCLVLRVSPSPFSFSFLFYSFLFFQILFYFYYCTFPNLYPPHFVIYSLSLHFYYFFSFFFFSCFYGGVFTHLFHFFMSV